MSSEKNDHFTSSFLIWMPLISFACSIALAKTSSTSLDRSGESDILVLFLILEEKLLFSPSSVISTEGVSYMAFIMLR